VNNYTREEIDILFNEVGNKLFTGTVTIGDIRLHRAIDRETMMHIFYFESCELEDHIILYSIVDGIGTKGHPIGFETDEPVEQIFEKYRLEECKLEQIFLIEVKKFLFVEPLEKVPLFINDFPELARWRLRIGK